MTTPHIPNKRPGRCKGPNCGKTIHWLPRERDGKLHPYDDLDGKVSHFSTCIDSQFFRDKTKDDSKGNRG